jgi:hypothetical protein
LGKVSAIAGTLKKDNSDLSFNFTGDNKDSDDKSLTEQSDSQISKQKSGMLANGVPGENDMDHLRVGAKNSP